MDCKRLKSQIYEYLDNELQEADMQQFSEHLGACAECQKAYEAIKRTWDALEVLPNVEPTPNYMSRFWAEVATRQNVVDRARARLSQMFLTWKLVPVYVSLCLAISVFAIRNYMQFEQSRQILAEMSQEEIEMVEYIELAENYELIDEIEFFEDFEIIQNLDDLSVTQS
ncbi:MAG: zf-HC2 domain-containing protein [Candidatus Omnitrophica bacterium]|nr:zf-HC2 domain-containing protein [Candidatus Omnitrophota bacterium]MBU1995701.1 zf-HC2 domain-containing protein [Candidatus Omnitrophota bacterium]